MCIGGAALLWLHPSALAFALGGSGVLAITSAEPRRRMARALAPYLPALLLLGAWALQALASRDGPGAPARTPPHWLGLKYQVLDLLRYGNVLAGTRDEIFVLALVALFGAPTALRPPAGVAGGRRL